MGELKSKLFTEADPATVNKLEDCALGRPNEVRSHFKVGHPTNARGEHIRRIQEALKNVQKNRPEFGIPEFDVNGIYDAKFAKAIYVYKQRRDIKNYANKIDDVVGMKTIRSLDSDNINRPYVPPEPKPSNLNVVPRADPNCVPEANCPFSKVFDVTLLCGASGGEGLDFGKYWFTIRDVHGGWSALYLLSGYGAGFSLSPVSVANGGEPRRFETSPTRVTDFGPTAVLAGGAGQVADQPISRTFLTLQYRPGGSGFKSTLPMSIDTGKIAIPGANINGATFKLLTTCRGVPGAVKRYITRKDLVFT